MPVLIFLTVKAMIEMMRKGEYRRLATRVLLVAVVVGLCCILARTIPSPFSRGTIPEATTTATTTTASSQETTLNLRLQSIRQVPARIPLSVAEYVRSYVPSKTSLAEMDLEDFFTASDYGVVGVA